MRALHAILRVAGLAAAAYLAGLAATLEAESVGWILGACILVAAGIALDRWWLPPLLPLAAVALLLASAAADRSDYSHDMSLFGLAVMAAIAGIAAAALVALGVGIRRIARAIRDRDTYRGPTGAVPA